MSEDLAVFLSKKFFENCGFSRNMWGQISMVVGCPILALINLGRCFKVAGRSCVKSWNIGLNDNEILREELYEEPWYRKVSRIRQN